MLNINDVVLPPNIDADIDAGKNRLEIHISGKNGGRIIAYYPTENLQVYVYEIDGTRLPDMWDLGLRMNCEGRYLRTLICKRGHGEFAEDSVNYNMSGGEFAMRCGIVEENRFCFKADSLVGIELVLQVDYAVKESILFRMLRTALNGMGIKHDDFQKNQWYFSKCSEESEKAVDRLLENCINGADSPLIIINVAEIGYNLGNDYKGADSKERKYPTNPQKAIAEDIHSQLTDNYGERLTASMFAEKYGLSDSTVKNYFKNVYGYGFKEYQMKVRMEKAATLLETTKMKHVEIAMTVGYSTQAKFIDAFKKYYNMTPSEYRLSKRISDIIN